MPEKFLSPDSLIATSHSVTAAPVVAGVQVTVIWPSPGPPSAEPVGAHGV